jgi:E3 Ubiquitin ligase
MPMTPQGAEILSGVSAAFAAIGLVGFFSRLRRDRAIGDTPLMHLRSAAQGYVKVAGRAQPPSGTPSAAPLSGRPCVWWNFRVDEQQGTDKNGHPNWVEIEHATSVEPFVLADDDAQCLVGPVQAEVTPTVDNVWYGNSSRPVGPPPAVNTLLLRGSYRYQERILAAGADVCVVGEFRSQSETGNVSAAIAAKLHEWKQDQKTLLARFDADHDGTLSAAEWEAARAAAAKECEVQNMSAHIDRVSVISEPTDGKPFMIAPLSPEQLERRERHRAWGYFAFGFAWILVCAWALSRAFS